MHLLRHTGLFAAALVASLTSHAADFNQFIAFGDSTLDSGYFRYNPTGNAGLDQAIKTAVAAGAKGGFAGPGTMDSTLLAERFGLSAAPFGNGGTNFANGGAQTVSDVPGNVATIDQIKHYLTSVNGVANPRGLYIVSTGNNDLIRVQKQGAAWITANPDHLDGVAAALAPEVAALQAAGARTIVVPNSYIFAALAGPGGQLPASEVAADARRAAFNSALWSRLTAAGVNYIPADMDHLFKYVIRNPNSFGFTAGSVLAANAPSPVSALITTTAMLSPEQERTHLFIDGAHVTTAGQQIEADYISSLLTAPSLLSLVAEGAVQGSLARTANVQTQIERSGHQREPGSINAWVSANANSLRLKNAHGFPTVSATPLDGTLGLDYQTPGGLLLGAALTMGTQHQHFSSGGHCKQTDEAASLFITYKSAPWWGDAVATFGLQQDRIERTVTIGVFTDRNRADTNGQSTALALRGGRDFHVGAITTGPVLGIVLQRLHLAGFTETGTSGVTALSFTGQTRNAAICQLGWRATTSVDQWQLSAEAVWNHDWADRHREMTLALTSITTPAFTADAAPVSADWATASLGTAYRLNSQITLHATGTVMIGNPKVTSYGGNLTLNISY
jgi:outer membrane lipase/esterase